MEKTNEEINIEIAKLLGFEIHYSLGGIPLQVSYPERYKNIIYSIPTDTIPNFVQMIDEQIVFIEMHPIVPQQRVRRG